MQQFGDGGLNDEGGTIDEVSGNEVPVGGTKEGVRDDIPANVSEGEFIFPEDVTRFIGLDKLMAMRQDAKMGLKKMEAMGQMGNSDEATMPDDMPFGMADLMVVSGEGKPMELAVGGFVPVENYTEVQDMISDKAKKGSGVQNFAPGGAVRGQSGLPSWLKFTAPEGTAVTQAAVSHTNPLTGETFTTMTGGYSIDYDNLGEPNSYRPSPPDEQGEIAVVPKNNNELDTADVPTFDPDKVVDYDAYMNKSLITAEEYRNSDGDSMIITFINGSPLTPVPPGYTLYIKPEEGAEETSASIVVDTVNKDKNNNSGKGRDINANQKPTGVDYAGMSDEDFIERMEYENTKGYKILRAVALGVTAMVPFGGALGYSAIRGAAISNEARLKQLRDSASGATKTTLNTLLDEFYKSNGMQDSTNSNEFQQWVDGVLVKLGFAPDQTKKAAAQAVAIDTEGGSSEFDKKIQKILKTETGRGNAGAGADRGIVVDKEQTTLPTTQTEAAFPQAGEFAGMAGAGPDPYSGDVVNSKYTGKDALPYYTSGVGVIDRTNTDFVNPENAEFRASQLQDRRISDTLTNENKYKKQGKDTNRLEYGGPVSGGVELQDMLTGDSTITPKQREQGEFENIPQYQLNKPSRTTPVPPLENYKSPDFSGGISNRKNEDGTVNATSFIKRGFNEYVRGLPPENYTAQDAGYENEFTSMGPSISQQDVSENSTSVNTPRLGGSANLRKKLTTQTQEAFPQTGGFSTAEAQREESRLGIDPPPPSVLTKPIGESIQTKMAVPVSNATTSVEGGRGAMPQYDGRALSGDLVDPRYLEDTFGPGPRLGQQTLGFGAPPGASDKFKAAIKPTTIKKKVAPKKEEPQASNVEQFQFSNFKANVITTPSTRTGKTFFGGNEKINPEGTPGKDSVGAFKQGLYAGDGFEWTTGGGRVYTGVNLNVTGSGDPMVATQPPTKDFFEWVGDLFDSDTSSSKPSESDTGTDAGTDAGTSTSTDAGTSSNTSTGSNTSGQDKMEERKQPGGDLYKAAKAETKVSTANIDYAKKSGVKDAEDYFVANKGGLASKTKPKAKKKTTNKRGLAARK